MSDIEELAKRRIYLETRLNSLQMMNVYGTELDELTRREVDRIETTKELNTIKEEIKKYEGLDFLYPSDEIKKPIMPQGEGFSVKDNNGRMIMEIKPFQAHGKEETIIKSDTVDAAELIAALEPLMKIADVLSERLPDSLGLWSQTSSDSQDIRLTVGDVRRIKEALKR